MCFVSMEAPEDYIGPFDVCGYVIGVLLSAFALWAKSDAYRVIGDFAWSTSRSFLSIHETRFNVC